MIFRFIQLNENKFQSFIFALHLIECFFVILFGDKQKSLSASLSARSSVNAEYTPPKSIYFDWKRDESK